MKMGVSLIAVVLLGTLAAATAGADGPVSPPAVGTAAPDFSLESSKGDTTKLGDFRGKWVVLYFYPKDFTSGCTLEAHNFQRDIAKYEALGAVVVGVSVDSASSHKDFCAKEGLSFKLLSDPEAKTSAAYGSLFTREGKKFSARNTFIVDKDGKVARTFIGVKPAEHSTEVLEALAKLKTP